MTADRGQPMTLTNETAINVAGLLKGLVGATRSYELSLDRLPLGDGMVAEEIAGEVRLTRLRDGIIADVDFTGVAPIECVRCLREYDQAFEASLSEEFRQSVDLRTGVELPPEEDEDEETSLIDENHELDFGEVMRQEILVVLPMRPDCGAACPGPALTELGEPIETPNPFSALADLLDDDVVEESDPGSDPGTDA
jgi:uncharacterized protein